MSERALERRAFVRAVADFVNNGFCAGCACSVQVCRIIEMCGAAGAGPNNA